MEELAPIQPRTRVLDIVIDRLRTAILDGDLAPGSHLSVPMLAERLQVSRSPVREALVHLVREGLALEPAPRQGLVVANVSAEDLVAVYEVREVLEGVASRSAAEAPADDLIATLEDIVARHREAIDATDLARHVELDLEFHAVIRDAAGNPYLARLLHDIQTQVRLAMLTTTVTAGPRQALIDHEQILAAIRDRRPEAAEQAARSHVARLRTALQEGAATPGERTP